MGKAERLKRLLASDRRTSDQANKAQLQAEDAWAALAEREQQRQERDQRGSR